MPNIGLSHPLLELDPRLPKGLTDCEVIGLSGNCDECCPVLLRGECEADNTIQVTWICKSILNTTQWGSYRTRPVFKVCNTEFETTESDQDEEYKTICPTCHTKLFRRATGTFGFPRKD